MSSILCSDAVKAKALELGFDLCGVAPAASFPELSFLREWLERGFAGNMAWMSRTAERRSDVRAILPGARTVIVTGTVYNTDRPYSTEVRDRGVALVSRYAWGDDYHDVLARRLDALMAWMHDTSPEPFDARGYVDTGPVQERVYAQYAGLGWIGKNTCLIHPEKGSWVFLSVIVCTLALEPDQPAFDQCGTCTLCLEACPTAALPAPHVLDATRCVSYLTIELRGDIPVEHREALGSHVYGCDICQAVCPYNHRPATSTDPAWQPRPALDGPQLVDLWRTADVDLRPTLRGTAMTRAKLTGLRRNVAVALGNHPDENVRAVALETADRRPSSTDEMVQRHVAWASRER